MTSGLMKITINTMSYYNTTKLEGDQLEIKMQKARSQKDIVLTIFETQPVIEYTPFDILRMWPGRKPPITSIRRCITDLTKEGYIMKTDILRKGLYGDVNHTWKLAS